MKNSNCFISNSKSVNGNYWKYEKPTNTQIDNLKYLFNFPDLLANIIARRKFDNEDLKWFLNPTLKNNLPDPSLLKNMNESINIFLDKILTKKNIGLIGDYDVDGATSSAILFKYLQCIGVKTEVYIPDRIKDGYGISKNSINFFLKKRINFLITLDCGTNDAKLISYAKEKGIDIIIIDHHEVKNLGKPLSIINPKLKEDKSGLDDLCTVGLAFLFIVGVNRELIKKNFFTKKIEPKLLEFLDIVALGTICDLVPLKKTNRLLVKKGLEIINRSPNKGLNILKNKLGLIGKIKASDLAYYLGPCINAAGRIGNPNLGFNLLTLSTEKDLDNIANKLIESNNQRKTLEIITFKKAKNLTDKETNKKFIFLYKEKWHPGILGIIASKLVEEFNVPAFVMSLSENKITGSARSVKGVNISKILSNLVELGYLVSGGGHAMAGGFKLKKEKVKEMQSYLSKNDKVFLNNEEKVINIDLVADILDLNINTIESIDNLAPFGIDHPEPKILIKNVSPIFTKQIGKDKNHLSCTLTDIYGKKIKAIAFDVVNKRMGKIIEDKENFDVIGKVNVNEWANSKSPQFLIEDLKLL